MKVPKRWPSITIFVVAQVAWVAVVTLWIIWYVRIHYAPVEHIGTWDLVIIIEGAILLVLILAGIISLFVLYQVQLTLSRAQMHLISSITHEFKTPLATTLLYLETLNKRRLPDETRQKLITGMIAENRRLESLVENFLESAKLGNRTRPYKTSLLCIGPYMDIFEKRYEGLLKGTRVDMDIEDELYCMADPNALDMVFTNLFENAIHYSPGECRILIKAWNRSDKWIHIEFSDTGIGIPKDKRKEVFKMFKRLPDGISLRGSGSGMGLYVVRGIISAHGGKIKVGDRDGDSGTTFLIRLPKVSTT